MLNFPSSSIQAPDNWAKRNRGAHKWLVVTATVATLLYVLVFSSGELVQGLRRADIFVWLLLPDALLAGLMGGSSAVESVLPSLCDRCLPFFVGSVWLAAATCIGRAITNPLVVSVGRLELIALSCLAGLSLLSTEVLLLGLAGWLTRFSVLLVAGASCALAYWMVQRWKGKDQPRPFSPPGYDEQFKLHSQVAIWLWRLVPVTVSILAATYLLNGLLPAFEFDVVEYHLQGPKEFYQAGRISFAPHNVYLNMPLASEMHSLAMMVLIGGSEGWWLGGMAGKLVIAAYSLLAALLASGFVVRHYGRTAGWSAAALLLASPGNIHVGGCGLIDSALGAYALASAIALQIYRDAVRHRSTAFSHLAAITCLFAFSAAACKYTGLVFVTVPVLLGLVVFSSREPRQLLNLRRLNVRLLAICTIIAFVTVGPWYLKNLVATGNPVFPLASSVFGAGNLQSDQIQRWQAAHRLPRASDGSVFGWQSISDALQRVLLKSEYLPIAIVPLGLIAVLVIPWADRSIGAKRKDWLRHPALVLVMGVIWILVAWFALTHRIDRFWLPALPMAAVVAAIAVHWLVANGMQSLVAAIVLLSTIFGLLISLSGLYCDSRWLVAYEKLRRDVTSDESLGRLPASIDWVNVNLPNEAKLLVIGQAQAYRFERQIAYSTCFNTPPGEFELRLADSTSQRSWLSDSGYTHLLVQWSEIDRYRSAGNYGFSSWPTRTDMRAMVESGVLRPVDWPIEEKSAELFEVEIRPGASTGERDAR